MKESRITYYVGEKGTRPWGEWQVLDLQSHVVVKKLLVYPGGRISLQRHQHRTERWIVTEGVAKVRCDNNVMHLSVGESIVIPSGSLHRLSNQGTTRGLRIFVEWIEQLPYSTTHITLSTPSVVLCYAAI